MANEFGSEALFNDFLKELQALDDFRTRYATRHEFEGLGREDQDVRRLIEALAFYSARTRRVSERAFATYRRQVLEKLFPHLLRPMPQMALLHPQLDSNMQEVRGLPAHTPITAHFSVDQRKPPLRFRTREEVSLWPLRFVRRSLRFEKRAPDANTPSVSGELGWRLRFSLATSAEAHVRKRFYAPRDRAFGSVTFFFDSGSDPLLAARLFHALENALVVVRCRFVSDGAELHAFETTGVEFGAPEPKLAATYENPLENMRRMVHFPAAEMRFKIPIIGAPAEWDRLEIEIDLNSQWPVGLALTEGALLLNALIVENLERHSAEPVELDGRTLRVPVVHPEPASGMVLRELLGVYEGDPAAPGARRTLFPNLLVEGGFSVDIDPASGDAWLEVDRTPLPEEVPSRLYLEAEWYQPEGCDAPSLAHARYATDTVDLALVRWGVAGQQSPCRGDIVGDETLLDRLVDLHGKSDLTLNDLKLLLRVLGVEQSELFGRIPKYLKQVATAFVRDLASPMGGVRSFDITFDALPPQLLPPVWMLFRRLPHFLSTWIGDCDVRLRILFEGQESWQPISFSWSAAHD